ncbi:MAG: sodium:solute symporter family protein [Acidobacteria bacterium]|nr:sodium:solute symporter family protein [Acidobacteriota bacterium]
MVHLLIIIGYVLLMLVLGAFFARKVNSSSDFYVARRDLGTGLLFATLLAANIGAGSTVGATGLGYRDGLSAVWWVASAGIGSLILAFTVGPRLWRIARDNNLYTVGDYLEYRYDQRIRGLVAVLLWVGSIAILAGQLMAIAWILEITTGLDKWMGCLIGAGVATAYFAAGGLAGTARVNSFQIGLKALGFGGAIAWLLHDIGGWDELRSAVLRQGSVGHLDPLGRGAASFWRYLIVLTPSFIISPGLLQKIFGARSKTEVQRGVALNGLALLIFSIVPVLFGLFAFVRFPDLSNRELAMPTLLLEALPVWAGGLLLGALFAAEVSTADAVIFMLSTSVVRDLYQRWLHPEASDHRLMTVTRFVAIVCGAIGGLTAIFLDSVVSALTIFYTLLTAALFLPIIGGLYLRQVGSKVALLSTLVSAGLTLVLELFVRIGVLHLVAPPLVWGLLSGAGTMLLACRRPGKGRHSKATRD